MANTFVRWQDVRADVLKYARQNSRSLGLSADETTEVERAALAWLGMPPEEDTMKKSSKNGKRKGC